MFYLVAIAQIILLSLTSILLIRLYRLSQSGKLNKDSTAVAMGFTDILTDVLPPIVGGKREGVRPKKLTTKPQTFLFHKKLSIAVIALTGLRKHRSLRGCKCLI